MLGDKNIDFTFYGITYRDQYIGGESSPVCKLVNYDTYGGYYFDWNGYPPPGTPKANWGKELNESVGLWRVAANASFNPSTLVIDKGTTLSFVCEATVNNNPPPLAVQMTNVDTNSAYWGFSTNPLNRLAYDKTFEKGYEHSALVADINYSNFCFAASPYVYDTTTPATNPAGSSLNSLASVINANPSKVFVTYIRPIMYYGTETPRTLAITANAQYINEIDGSTSRVGVPYADVLTYKPVPELAATIRSRIQDGHDDWESTKIYAPFGFNPSQSWYDTEGTNSDQIHRIGTALRFTVNNVVLGAGSPRIERGQYFRCNFDEKIFEDVAYKWELVCYCEESNRYIEPGYDLTNLNLTDHLRFFTKLVVTDTKGNTIGQATVNAVLHELAYIGFYFGRTTSIAQNTDFNNDDLTGVYCPIFDNGTTTGLYATGDDIKSLPQYGADSVGGSAFRYDPQEGEEGDFSTVINKGTIGAGASYYALTEAEMNSLATWLNTTYTPTDETQLIQDFKGVNPADYITTVMYYPFDIPVGAGASEQITVGKITALGCTGFKLLYEYGNMYDFGSYRIPENGNYLDYMRKITVMIPFCGSVDLDPKLWTGKLLTVKMAIDFPTGFCTAYLYRDNGIMDSISGSVGVPLPLSALSNGDYQVSITNQIKNKESMKMGAIFQGAAGVAQAGLSMYTAKSGEMGNVGGIISGAMSAVGSIAGLTLDMPNAEYNIEHTVPAVSEISGGSPFLNCGADYRVKILVCTPIYDKGYDATAYGKTTGFACCKQGTLKNISSGFTACAGIDLAGVDCTATEKSMIFNAVQKGVYL